jgi:hypothetical protein
MLKHLNMKKLFVAIFSISLILFLSNCHTPKQITTNNPPPPKVEDVKKPAVTYKTDITAVIMSNCTPCHIPSLGGKKTPLDNFASVQKDVDSIISRISRNPNERGFMPWRGAVKLSEANISLFKQWKEAGTPEQ